MSREKCSENKIQQRPRPVGLARFLRRYCRKRPEAKNVTKGFYGMKVLWLTEYVMRFFYV